MPRRIAVVISQSPTNSPKRRELEEELATKLLFERGVDVSLVPHVHHLESGSTGLLCLEGVKGDMVLLAWCDPEESQAALRKLGIAGRAGRTSFSKSVEALLVSGSGPQAQRYIYFLDLRDHASAEPFLDEVQRIREETNVQTVSLGAPKTVLKRPATTNAAPSPRGASGQAEQRTQSVAASFNPHDDTELDARVDELLDEFDQADW